MADSQVEGILPVLSRCHQRRFFTIPENKFPVATVEKLLRHPAGLCSLELELYCPPGVLQDPGDRQPGETCPDAG